MILSNMIQQFCPNVDIVGQAGNAQTGENLIRVTNPDVVFMDIEMPYGSGFDVLDRLRPLRFDVIFVTAFNEHTLKAIRYAALDYLLKPVNIEELQQAVGRIEEHVGLRNFEVRLDGFLQSMRKLAVDLPRIALPGKNGVVFIPVQDIIRCEGLRGYTTLYVKGKSKIISSKNITEYEAMLPEHLFYRVHHSHLVNLSYICGYQRGRGGYVEMEDGAVIEVAVRRKTELMERLGLSNNF